MKKWIVALPVIFFCTEVWASLQGQWVMTAHTCTSGAPPRDNFVPGRDSLEVSFYERHFRTQNRVGPCQSWTSGTYETRGQLLTMHIQQAGSTCGPNPPGTFTYHYEIHSDEQFSIYIGPFNGGTCPSGDLLQNTFTRSL